MNKVRKTKCRLTEQTLSTGVQITQITHDTTVHLVFFGLQQWENKFYVYVTGTQDMRHLKQARKRSCTSTSQRYKGK